MEIALQEAKKAYNIKEVPIGCVIVKDGEIIAKAYNKRESYNNVFGHAEVIAIKEACENCDTWKLDGAVLYVTVEPCMMCIGAIIQSRISRVVYGAKEHKNGAVDSKFQIKDIDFTHKLEVTSGVLEEECKNIMVQFFKSLRE